MSEISQDERFEIYVMHLHETIRVTNCMQVTRVPGGWLYRLGNDDVQNTTFVPFDNEFQQDKTP